MGHCSKCGKLIIDKYVMCTDNRYFHWNCLRCQSCGCILDSSCHVKNGRILCKKDYLRLCHSYSCKGCFTPIENNKDYVVKIPSSSATYALYHINCIQCTYCKKNLNPGDQYVLNKMNQTLICLSSPCISHYNSFCSANPATGANTGPGGPTYPSSMPSSPMNSSSPSSNMTPHQMNQMNNNAMPNNINNNNHTNIMNSNNMGMNNNTSVLSSAATLPMPTGRAKRGGRGGQMYKKVN